MKKVVIAAGGTGGHIIPAIAMALEFKANNIDVVYIGNVNSLEEKLAKQNNLSFYGIDVQKLYRKLTIKHFAFPFKLINAVLKSRKIIKANKPDCFIGAGGFVSGPAGLAALNLKLPCFLQEQNSSSGITNRFLAKYSKKVYTGFTKVNNLDSRNCLFSGNPIYKRYDLNNKQQLTEELGFDNNKQTILITGGSQGSRAINTAVNGIIDDLLQSYNVIWQTGKLDFARYKNLNKKGLYVFDFSSKLNAFCALADLAVTRAGALTLAELEADKLPSILIPYPYAAGNHQYYNALQKQQQNQAILLEQKDLSAENLLKKIDYMFENLQQFVGADYSTKHNYAAKTIVEDIIKELAGKNK